MFKNSRVQRRGSGKFFIISLPGVAALAMTVFGASILGNTYFSSHSAYAASINMSVSPNIKTDILPTNPDGTENSSDTNTSNISVFTDSSSGYTLSIASSSATSPALTGENGSISSISSEQKTISDFTKGSWGYKPTKKINGTWNNLIVKHGDANYTSGYYLPGPTTTGDILDITDSANPTNNEYNLAIATKIGSETKIGSYSSAFVVTAVANKPIVTLSQITYMQEMTPEICAASYPMEENQLIDTRDNKRYLVGKYEDDRCWMNQNLALGGHEAMTLTPNDTDIPSNWVLPASVSMGNWSGQYSSPELYAYSADNPDDAYTYQYGNYYNMLAATAGSLVDEGGDAPNSICPKGWRLPTGGSTGELRNFAVLKYQWSLHSPAASARDGDPFGKLSGRYNGNLIEQGNSGYWWSSTTLGASFGFLWQTTFDMMEFVSYVYPAYSINDLLTGAGLSVRCVARKSHESIITWNANGGTVSPTTSDIEYGDAIGVLPTPTYADHNFLGWFTDPTGGTEITAETIATTNAIYYAHWEKPMALSEFLAVFDAAQDGDTITITGNIDGEQTNLSLNKNITINANGHSLSNFTSVNIESGTYNNIIFSGNNAVNAMGGTINNSTFSNNNTVNVIDGAINNSTFSGNNSIFLTGGHYSYPVIGTNTFVQITRGYYDYLSIPGGLNDSFGLAGGYFYPFTENGYLTMQEADSFARGRSFCALPSSNPIFPNYFMITADPIECFGGEGPVIDPYEK